MIRDASSQMSKLNNDLQNPSKENLHFARRQKFKKTESMDTQLISSILTQSKTNQIDKNRESNLSRSSSNGKI